MTAITVYFLVYFGTGIIPQPYATRTDCEAAATAGVVHPTPIYPNGWASATTIPNLPQVHQCIQAPLIPH